MKRERFGLYLILTDPLVGYAECARAAVSCGVRYLQLRMKNTPRKTTLQTAREIRRITEGSATLFIVNDDLSIAIESDADGLHLGQSDLALDAARQQWNDPRKLFGLSTHSLRQAQAAETAAPDYIGIGPVFPTPTKPDADPALGAKAVGRIATASTLTSVAIGGINASTLPTILKAGAQNYCVVQAVNRSKEPEKEIQKLQEIWQNHCPN